jgi:uncharacterized membrane protein YbhN (UPF0104 family)/membrane-associated phospholipid phosphatase
MARGADTGKAPGPGRRSLHLRRRVTRRRDVEPQPRDADPRHAAGWIRDEAEPGDRRPADIALLVVAVVGLAVAGVWAQAGSGIDLNLMRPINDLTSDITTLGKAVYGVGSIWVLVATVVALVLFGHRSVALRALLAGVSAWGIAVLLNHLLGHHDLTGVSIHVRAGGGPVFPASNVAVVTALAITLGPFLVRPARRGLHVLVAAVAVAALYLGVGFPSDVLGGLLLGIATSAAVLVALGSPAGRLSIDELSAALADLGLDVAAVRYADAPVERATVADVRVVSGDRYVVQAFGRDQRDARLAAKAWHWLMYKDPSQPVFGSRIQEVEHIAYSMLLAAREGVRAPSVVRTGVGGRDSAILVTGEVPGAPLAELPDERLTDALLADLWDQVERLHAVGVSHGNLDARRIVADADAVALTDFSSADATAQRRGFDRDIAAVVVGSALRVGDERATAAAVEALGPERLSAVLPIMQPAALPTSLGRAEKHLGRRLKSLTAHVAAVTGAEEVKPTKIRRLSWTSVAVTLSVLLAAGLLISGLQGVNFQSVKSEFTNATWGWVVAALMIYPLTIISFATSFMGCVNTDLPFVPTVLMWVSASLLNLITPNGIGGTALQFDYLRKQGVPAASSGSALALSGTVGYVFQLLLLVGAASLTSSQLNLGSGNSGSLGLLIVAVVAAIIGALLLFPKLRGKVVPQVKRAASDVWAVLRTPKKALQLFGGALVGNLVGAAVLGLCLLAFGQHLAFAQLLVVQLGAGVLASLAPVPGGIGVQEAALTGALTGFGVASAPALAGVLVYRGVTFALPPIVGFFTLRWLRKRGYV